MASSLSPGDGGFPHIMVGDALRAGAPLSMTTPRTITLMEGDGIGPECAEAALRVMDAAGVTIQWERALVGEAARNETGALLPDETLDSIRRNGVAFKGPITTPVGEGFPSINVALRQKLALYASVRPIKSIPGVPSPFDDIDLVVIRENTEDLYAGKEHEVVPGVIESLKIITEVASARIAQFAFRYAKANHRRKVTAVHKANIMKLSDGLFLECSRRASKGYPDVEYTEMIVDNTCMQMVYNPHQFDLLLTPNLYGDIISDLGAGLVGGLGLVPGANFGMDGAVFEAVHGSWPEAAGEGIANPTAMILTAAMMLHFIGEESAASRIRGAVAEVYAATEVRTPDLGGAASTTAFAEEVAQRVEATR